MSSSNYEALKFHGEYNCTDTEFRVMNERNEILLTLYRDKDYIQLGSCVSEVDDLIEIHFLAQQAAVRWSELKSKKKHSMRQIAKALEKSFLIHKLIEVNDDSITLFHNCGCHESLLDAEYGVEPKKEFQKFCDRYGVWFEKSNPEAGTLRYL